MRHAIDPHKDIGLEPAPIQGKSFYFNNPSSKIDEYIINREPIEIYIEIKNDKKSFSKNDIEFRLF